MTGSPYTTYIEIKLIDHFSPGMGVIAAGLKSLQKHFDTMTAGQKAAMAGFAGIAGGMLGVAAAFREFGGAGMKLVDQQQQMVNKGIELNNVLGIQADYFNKIAKAVPTVNAVEYLKTVQDLRGVLGSDSAAIAAAPQAAKIDTLLGEKSAYDVFRAFEKKGVTQDSEKQQQILGELYPYLQLFKEKVKAGDVSNFATRAGAAWITTDLAKTAPYLLPLIADLRGDTAGVTMNQLHKFIQGGAVLSKQQTEALESIGLIDMTKAHKTGFGGGRTQLDIGAIKDSLKYASDDPGWVRNVLQPAIEAYAHGDPALASAMRSKLFPNQSQNRAAFMLGDPEFVQQAEKDKRLASMVPGLDRGYQNAINNNPVIAMKALSAQFESFKEAVGAPMVQGTIPFLRSLTGALSDLGAAANAHPKLATNLVLAGGGALGGAVLGGSLGAIGGPLGMAGGAVLGGLTGLAVANWPAVLNGLTGLKDGIASIASVFGQFDFKGMLYKDAMDTVAGINNLMNQLGYKIMDGWKNLANSFNLSFDWLGAKIIAAWNSLAGMIPGLPRAGGQLPRPGGHPGEAPGDNVQHGSLVPPAKHLAINIPVTVQMDGRKMAAVVTNQMVASATYPTSASGADGRGLWQGPSAYSTEQG